MPPVGRKIQLSSARRGRKYKQLLDSATEKILREIFRELPEDLYFFDWECAKGFVCNYVCTLSDAQLTLTGLLCVPRSS